MPVESRRSSATRALREASAASSRLGTFQPGVEAAPLGAPDGTYVVHLLASVTKDLTDRVKAGQLVKELAPIVGGGGGGRPDFAEAGGKDASKIDEMLARARQLVESAIG